MTLPLHRQPQFYISEIVSASTLRIMRELQMVLNGRNTRAIWYRHWLDEAIHRGLIRANGEVSYPFYMDVFNQRYTLAEGTTWPVE